MAKSPFPGMDPFLERIWGDVHGRLIIYICDQLQEKLPVELCARLECRVLVASDSEAEKSDRYPDVYVTDSGVRGASTAVLELPEAASAEPDLLLTEARNDEPVTQRFIEIVDADTRSRLVTRIELVSPSNKLARPGRTLYLQKRDECLAAGVNFVEIDLTRSGNRLAILPVLDQIWPQPTYLAWVRRATLPNKVACYLMPLDRPLRRIRVPLRATDDDAVLDLQPLFDLAYQRGRYGNTDYTRPLVPPPRNDEAVIIEHLLRQAGKLPGGGAT